MTPLVTLSDVSKDYPRTTTRRDRLLGLLHTLTRSADRHVERVLDQISLVIEPGQSMAIIGENGAGKSTLLKLIAGVLHPTEGQIVCRGLVAAMLELGGGFHPEYSGIDNLKSAASLYGVSDEGIISLLPDIIQFSGLDEAELNQPVKTYSSGMQARLGFSLMTALKPDLLITDEVLSVGDESFQKKCITWIEDYLSSGGTLLMVSHSTYHIQKLCQSAMWLEQGKVLASGDAFVVCQAYHRQSLEQHGESLNSIDHRAIQLDQAIWDHQKCASLDDIQINETNVLRMSWPGQQRLEAGWRFRFRVYGTDGQLICCQNLNAEEQFRRAQDEPHVLRTHWSFSDLLPGHYTLDAVILDETDGLVSNLVDRSFRIPGRSRAFGSLRVAHQWRSE